MVRIVVRRALRFADKRWSRPIGLSRPLAPLRGLVSDRPSEIGCALQDLGSRASHIRCRSGTSWKAVGDGNRRQHNRTGRQPSPRLQPEEGTTGTTPPVRKASWKLHRPRHRRRRDRRRAPATWSPRSSRAASFGYTLLWAAVIGCLVKISLAEAAGRWHLATGRTLFDGWRAWAAGPRTSSRVYVVDLGLRLRRAPRCPPSALPLQALFPDVHRPQGVGHHHCGLVGLVFVWFNQYAVFEKVMTVLVGVMFVVDRLPGDPRHARPRRRFAGLLPVLPDGRLDPLHPRPDRRRRRHHHPGRVRLLGQRQGLDRHAAG